MNQDRYNRLLKQLQGTAEKVYNAVPQNEAWTIRQIITEMKRLTGTNPDYAIVQGCLNTMTNDGLIRQNNNVSSVERWQRVMPSVSVSDPMKGALATALEGLERVPATPVKEDPPFDPVHRLKKFSERLTELMLGAVEEIEAITKLIEDERITVHADTKKLKALKELLGDL